MSALARSREECRFTDGDLHRTVDVSVYEEESGISTAIVEQYRLLNSRRHSQLWSPRSLMNRRGLP